MKRLHNTNNDKIDFNQVYNRQTISCKPYGFWYSIDNDWLEWCEGNMPDWAKANTVDLFVNMDDILVIDNATDLESFVKQYGIEENNFILIDWEKVAVKYKGIEFQDYWSYRRVGNHYNYRNMWLYGYDCSGGCIWDLTAIEYYKTLPTDQKYMEARKQYYEEMEARKQYYEEKDNY